MLAQRRRLQRALGVFPGITLSPCIFLRSARHAQGCQSQLPKHASPHSAPTPSETFQHALRGIQRKPPAVCGLRLWPRWTPPFLQETLLHSAFRPPHVLIPLHTSLRKALR